MIKRYVCFADGVTRSFNRHELDYPEPKRARRIRDKQRMKARARRVFTKFYEIPLDRWRSNDDRLNWEKDCQHLADNLAHCSKRCCNRPRDIEGPNMQERRAKMMGT